MNAADAVDGALRSVTCQQVRTGRRVSIRGRWFLDSTGDGCVGFLGGADFEQTDRGHMGASNLWNIQCLCDDEDPLSSELEAAARDATFPRCPWAVDLTDKPFPGRTKGKTALIQAAFSCVPAAVRLALGETQMLGETRSMLEDEGLAVGGSSAAEGGEEVALDKHGKVKQVQKHEWHQIQQPPSRPSLHLRPQCTASSTWS